MNPREQRSFLRTDRRRAGLFLELVVATLAIAVGCSDDTSGSGGGATAETPGQKLCRAAAEVVPACGEGSCDAALAADCTEIVTVLSDPLLGGAKTCLDGGGQILSCLVSAAGELPVGEAQQTFADGFCADCALGAPGCEEIAKATTAFGDEVLEEIASTCFTGLTCVPSLPSCVQGVLVARSIPEATAECLVRSFFDSSGSESGCGGSGP